MNTSAVDNRRLRERERGGRGGVVGVFSSKEYYIQIQKSRSASVFLLNSSNGITEYFTGGRSLIVRCNMEIVIGLLLSSLSLYCDFTDAECPVISPARLVVKYGDPASSNCSSDTPVVMGWEATKGEMGLTDKKVKFLNWRVDSVTDWNNKPKCYTDGGQCLKQLNITVYKLPDSVSMTGPSGPMVEGKEYKFKCLIQNVAPINSLNVSFYKTSTTGKKTKTLLDAPDVPRQTTKEPITGMYTLLWSPSKGDDGAQLWCSALLGLGELGPQPPPEMESEPFNLSVHYAECPVISPARLVVKYGDPASSNCSSDPPVEMGWEATQGGTGLTDKKVKFLNWRVNSLTEWNMKPKCYTDGGQCLKQLDITVYKLPDSVSISYRKYPDPMAEGDQYQLQCHVQNIAPIERLRVTFYKVNTTGEQTELDTKKFKDNINTPVNKIYTLDFTASRDDDGAQLWCSAMLDLGPEGPQPPPVMKSDNLNITVHYKPQITMSHGCFSMSITEGDTLSLNCSAKGNPSPSYDWLLPQAAPNTTEERSVVTIINMAKSHSGEYTCIAINPLGNSTCTVKVEVTVDYLPIIAGLAAAALVIILAISCFIYSSYYKHRRMGHYQLKDFLPRRHKNKHVAHHNGMDQSFM